MGVKSCRQKNSDPCLARLATLYKKRPFPGNIKPVTVAWRS